MSENIYVTEVSEVPDVPCLQLDGKRATRARYPDLPGGIDVSCADCVVKGTHATWKPRNVSEFGSVT